jgi:hypothetical protein
VTYVVTANGFFSNDTATVVITIGVGTTNLAFGKPADFSRIGCNMKVLLISVGAEICFIRNTNLIVA